MKIQSVAILGAGAVGCYVLWGLADKAAANTLQLGVVAEGSCAERLRQNHYPKNSITRRSGPRSRPTASIC